MRTKESFLAFLTMWFFVVRAGSDHDTRIYEPTATCENTVDAPCALEKDKLVDSNLVGSELEYACVDGKGECKKLASGFYRYFPYLCKAEVRLGTSDTCGCCVYR
eukprot:scaffold1440_cov332-Pavlova_lutheri.AAC.25